MRGLRVLQAGPGLLVQDAGRPGYLAQGISRGGAADGLALVEGAALLGQKPGLAVLEMAGMGGVFEAVQDMRIALTGAPMRAMIDDAPVVWNAAHALLAGQRLTIGAATRGVYGYLHVGGGVDAPKVLGSRSTHLTCGLGHAVTQGDMLPVGRDDQDMVNRVLDVDDRFNGGTLRILAGPQTALFAETEVARFQGVTFTRDPRGNRQGVRLNSDGAAFATNAGLSILSEVIVPGDIQITGDGAPFILLADCQTTGGYPRIGSVIPSDMPRVAQAGAGVALRFELIDLDAALAINQADAKQRKALASRVRPLIRNPHDIKDLLSYQLISGMTAGTPQEEH